MADMSRWGRQRPIAASGSSRWPDLVAESVTHLRVPPSPNVKFRSTADGRPRSWPTSGIGARRHSPVKSERQQPVWFLSKPRQPRATAQAETSPSPRPATFTPTLPNLVHQAQLAALFTGCRHAQTFRGTFPACAATRRTGSGAAPCPCDWPETWRGTSDMTAGRTKARRRPSGHRTSR